MKTVLFKEKIKNIFKKIVCFVSTHRWVDVTFVENANQLGPTYRYCRRCKKEEHKQIQNKYSTLGKWRKA